MHWGPCVSNIEERARASQVCFVGRGGLTDSAHEEK
jgi:hypothetical protein